MSLPPARLSIRVPRDLALALRRHVGARGLPGFVARAIANELEHEQLGSFLDERTRAHGEVPNAALVKARRAWSVR